MKRGDYEFEVYDRMMNKPRLLVRYHGKGGVVSIPEGISILEPECGFRGNETLEEVVLPESLLEVPEGVFQGCTNLRKVEIHGQTIGKDAFRDCTCLNEALIGREVEKIEEGAFLGTSLKVLRVDRKCRVESGALTKGTKVVYDKGYSRPPKKKVKDKNIMELDGWRFAVDDPHLYVVCRTNEGADWSIQDGMSIRPWEPDCGYKEPLAVPEEKKPGLPEWLKRSADADLVFTCPGIQKTFPDTFSKKEEVYRIDSLESLEEKKEWLSAYNRNLEIQGGVLFDAMTMTTLNAIASMDEAIVPDGTKVIGQASFMQGCYSKVMLPETVEHIGPLAFFGCLDLETIEFPLGLRCICTLAFTKTKLKKVYVPKTCFIHQNAFDDEVEVLFLEDKE